MPFKTINDLPESVRNAIPSNIGKEFFRRVFNASLQKCNKESAVNITLNALQNAGYSKNKDDKFIFQKADKSESFTCSAKITKLDNEKRLVYGFASVIEENGQTVIDRQDDIIKPDELVKAAHKFISDARVAKMMHDGEQVGEVVESIVFTEDVQEALGIDLNKVGWFIAMKIHNDDVWEKFKSGELEAFSIGGRAKSIEQEA